MRVADGGGGTGTAKRCVARLTGRVRAERQRNRRLIAIRGQLKANHEAPCLTETEIFDALGRAWLVASVAAVLFCGALALTAVWDRAIFFEALHDALTTNPEWPQPPDVPVDAEAVRDP
jgi:hypothetical protein